MQLTLARGEQRLWLKLQVRLASKKQQKKPLHQLSRSALDRWGLTQACQRHPAGCWYHLRKPSHPPSTRKVLLLPKSRWPQHTSLRLSPSTLAYSLLSQLVLPSSISAFSSSAHRLRQWADCVWQVAVNAEPFTHIKRTRPAPHWYDLFLNAVFRIPLLYKPQKIWLSLIGGDGKHHSSD